MYGWGKKNHPEPMVPVKDSSGGIGNSKYEIGVYDDIAYKVMSSKAFQSKDHLATALRCSTITIQTWLDTHPTFKDAFAAGKAVGAQLTREKIADHAFCPSKEVNNGLIKLLAANVYGIKEDPTTVINVNQENNQVIDVQTLKDRGIPIPDESSCDVEDVEED